MKKKVIRNCIPAMLCMFVSGINTIIDGLFIGRNIGAAGLAAINIAWPVPAVIIAMGTAIGVGGGMLIAAALGQNNDVKVSNIIKSMVVLFAGTGVLLSLFFLLLVRNIMSWLGAEGDVLKFAIEYGEIIAIASVVHVMAAGMAPLLRNIQLPIQAMISMVFGVLLNICLNYIFVYKMGMEIQGTAFGTVISQCFVIMLDIIFLKKYGKKYAGGKVSVGIWKDILQRGGAVFGIAILPTWVLAWTNYKCQVYGGTEAVAVYGVISYLIFPVQSLLNGICDGVQPIMSYYKGTRDNEKSNAAYRIGITGMILVGLLCGIVIWVGAKHVYALFGLTFAERDIFVRGIRASSLSLVFYGISRMQITSLNVNGFHYKSELLIYSEAVIVPVLLMVLPLVIGMNGVWLEPLCAVVIENILIQCLNKSDRRN